MSISVNKSTIDLKNGLQQNVIVENTGAITENVTLTDAISGVSWSDDDGINWNIGNDSFNLDPADEVLVGEYTQSLGLSTNAYQGGAYCATLNRIYLAPYAQGPQSTWHYIDCTDGTVHGYTHGASGVGANAYGGAIHDPIKDRIYLIPDGQGGSGTWHYIDCTDGTVHGYVHGATVVVTGYLGACYESDQDRIYFVPTKMGNQTNWHYIDCNTGNVVAYAHGTGVTSTNSYAGNAAFDSVNHKIYLPPYGQGAQTQWHYINTLTGAVVPYTHGATVVATPYWGAAYDSDNNRTYFVPSKQAPETDWHYVTGSSDVVSAYTHGGTGLVLSAYNAAYYDSTTKRVYMSPYLQTTQTNWHYVSVDTNTATTYPKGVTISAGNYAGIVLSPDQERLYLMPVSRTNLTPWHYIVATPPEYQKTYKFKYDNSITFSLPSQVSFVGSNTEDIYCDVNPSKNFGEVPKNTCSSIYTLKVENVDSVTKTVSSITAPTGFECKKLSDSTWVGSIPTFDILASAYEDIQFRSCTSEIGTVSGNATLSYNPTIVIPLSVTSLAGDFRVSYINNHVDTAKGRLIRQYRQGSNVEDICEAFVDPLQQVEDDMYELYSTLDIDVMTGVNLDRIGAIIGQPRSGFDDDTYRVFLKGRVGINNSRGTLNDIVSLWNNFNPGETIQVNEQYPAQVELLTTGVQATQQIQDFIYDLMNQALQAGVKLVWILPYTVKGDGIFKFDSTASADHFDTGVFNKKLNT